MEALNLPLEGKIYASPMPFSLYDPGHDMLRQYRSLGISTVVLLAERAEWLENTGMDLPLLYAKEGWDVLLAPIPDFATPSVGQLHPVMKETSSRLQKGENIVVHCHAGLGRSGLFLACLEQEVLHIPADEAIRRVREIIPQAIETEAQAEFVKAYTLEVGNVDS